MSREYYFLISQLPWLELGTEPGLTVARFLDGCRPQLAPQRYGELVRTRLAPDHEPCCESERRWQDWEIFVRNCLARARAGAAGRDPRDALRPEPDAFPSAARMVEQAWSNSRDPLARERALDEQRWQRLDDLAVGHAFDFDALVLYRLRLELAEKWAAIDADAGADRFRQLVAAGVEQAEQQRRET